jgi:adenosylhomocysteine nucleosidase
MKQLLYITFVSIFFIFNFFSAISYAKTIGILSAMPAELESLKNKISKQKEISKGIIKGKIGSHTVYATLSGIGKVNAAAMAQKLISEYNINILIFSGVAGGINPAFNVGDVVIVSQAFQHDFGYLGEKFKIHAVGTLPEIGIGTGNESVYFDLSNFWQKEVLADMKKNAVKFSKSFANVQVNNKEYLPVLKLNGIVATGDQFIANEAKKQSLRDQKADIIEMEGAAVAQITQKNEVPCLILRSLSDKAGEKANIDFQKFFEIMATNNSSLVAYLVEQLP